VRWKIVDDESLISASSLGHFNVAFIEAVNELAHRRHHIGLLRCDHWSGSYDGDGDCDNYFGHIVLLLCALSRHLSSNETQDQPPPNYKRFS